MLTQPLVDYIINGLEAAPRVQSMLLAGDVDWDAHPDPERFSLREMVAHLADWEDIWAVRIHRFLTEDHPILESIDEGKMAIERNYPAQDPYENLKRYEAGRAKLVDTLRALPLESWARTGHRQFVGDLTVFELAALINGHDGYHLKQTVGFLD